MKKIFTFLSLPFLVYACYEDKGNYNYREINQITIQLGENNDSIVKCDQMDFLSIPVTLEGTQYSDTTRFTYFWEVNQKTVATTKDLNVYANFPLGNNVARFVITDKELGTKAFKNFTINVSSSTAGDGILVLSKYRGHAELSFKRLDKEGSIFSPNYYEGVTGHILGVNPRKIHRNYLPEKNANTGLKIETDHRLKSLSEETLVEVEENMYLDHNFFMSRIMTLPPDISTFDVQACWQQHTSIMSGFMYSAITAVVANDELHYDNAAFVPAMGDYWQNMGVMCRKSPWKGVLSPVLFPAYVTGNGASGYDVSDHVCLFDETKGEFVYASVRDVYSTEADMSECSELGSYSGYVLLYGTHTATPRNTVAVLGNGMDYRMLYLKVPAKAGEVKTIPFSVLADAKVSADVLNDGTRYYPMKNEPYLLFTTDDGLYRFNLRDLENRQAPSASDKVKTLADFGYGSDARITCMEVSRTEQEILLGISRYGDDTEGMSDELKGDVLVLNLKTFGLIKKYERVSGYPVDIHLKYQQLLVDGKENGAVKDVLHF